MARREFGREEQRAFDLWWKVGICRFRSDTYTAAVNGNIDAIKELVADSYKKGADRARARLARRRKKADARKLAREAKEIQRKLREAEAT